MRGSCSAILAIESCIVAALPALLRGASPLENGGFEAAGTGASPVAAWSPVFPMNVPQKPTFARDESVKREGAASARIQCPAQFGYVSLTQTVELTTPARTAILRGALRTKLESGFASLLLLAVSADGVQLAISPIGAASLSGERDWETRALHVALPDGTARLLVRAGMHGAGTAWFDDLSLSLESGLVAPERGLVILAEAEGAYRASAPRPAGAPTVTVSVPGPFEGQMPLSYEVSSTPPDAIKSWKLLSKGENRFLVFTLRALKSGATVKLRWKSTLLLRERPGMFGLGTTPIALETKVPAALRPYLRAAPGVEIASPEVAAAVAALSIGDAADARSLLQALSAFLEKRVSFAGGEDQGAIHTLRAGKAVCTGFANAACAMLIAKGIPTRILANVMTGSSAQEHYITESHVARYGWVRYESTQRRFPVGDTEHIILRVVGPDDRRSPLNVPLFCESSGGIDATFDMAFSNGTCWHASQALAQASLPHAAVDEVYAALERFWKGSAGTAQAAAALSARDLVGSRLPDLVPASK